MEKNNNTTTAPASGTPKQPPTMEPNQFRILCPSARTGAVIGKGGSSVRHIQALTGAKIRLLDDPHVPPCDERVILITNPNPTRHDEGEDHPEGPAGEAKGGEAGEWGPVRKALVRVFEKIVKGDSEEELGEEVVVGGKMLVGAVQAGSVLGKGGKVLEGVRAECGAQQIVVLPRDQIPPCAFHGDELILITGSYEAVKRSLLCISTCLQDEPWSESANLSVTKPSGASGHHADYHSRGYHSNMGSRGMGGHGRKVIEEEVVFKLLCHCDRVGSLIGKGGCKVRALENETGASIKMAEAIPDSDERVVVIAARESSEQVHSSAQDAVLRVHARLTEIGFERGNAVVARLLVHPYQIGRLLGKGGQVISEMRQITGASIRIFPKEKAPKYGSQNDEIVHVVGSFQCVQDALFHITSRLRDIIFPGRPPFSGSNFSPFPEMPHSQFRPRHGPGSPDPYHSPVGPYHNFDHQHPFSYGMDHSGPNMDRGPFPYGSERHGPPFEHTPRSWTSQPYNEGDHRGVADVGPGLAGRNAHLDGLTDGSSSFSSSGRPVEVVIPQRFLCHVYGENSNTLNQIKQISGADVTVHDPKLGASEGVVTILGTPEQLHTAQMLLHAFILCGETTS